MAGRAGSDLGSVSPLVDNSYDMMPKPMEIKMHISYEEVDVNSCAKAKNTPCTSIAKPRDHPPYQGIERFLTAPWEAFAAPFGIPSPI